MPSNPEIDLAPATVESLRAIWTPPVRPEIDEERLAAFAFGLLTPSEREALIPLLAASPALRTRMVGLRKAPPAWFVAKFAQGLAPDEGASGGVEYAVAALRTGIGAIGRTFRRLLETPQYALARGGDGRESTLEATVRDGGDLWVHITGLSAAYEARSLDVRLVDPCGGSLSLGHGAVSRGEMTLRVLEVGDFLGFGVGPLPPSMFRYDGIEGPRPRLFVDLPDGDVLALDVQRPPRLEGGHLRLSLTFPVQHARSLRGYALELSLTMGNGSVAIGAWPLRDWEGETLDVAVPMPGVSDAPIVCGSVLSARLIPQ